MTADIADSDDIQIPEMTQLFLGLLYKGPAWTADDSDQVRQDQRQHLRLLFRLRDEGTLLLSGPIPEGDPLRGIVAVRADSIEEARGYFAGDSHLESGRLILEILPWLVSAQVVARLRGTVS